MPKMLFEEIAPKYADSQWWIHKNRKDRPRKVTVL